MVNEEKLNLACGDVRIEGYHGIDYKKTEAADTIMDLEVFPWDIASESASDIICSHYVEHTPTDTYAKRVVKAINGSDDFVSLKEKVAKIDLNAPSDGLILFMDEVYRILKPGGTIKIVAPYYASIRAWQDPTHRRAISDATFLYFNKGWRDANRLSHYDIKSDFDFTYGYDINGVWNTKHDEARNHGILHYINVVNDIHVVLTKRKEEAK